MVDGVRPHGVSGSLPGQAGFALLASGLVAAAVVNGLAVALYPDAFESLLDRCLFFLAFTGAAGLVWSAVGWLGGLLLGAILRTSSSETRSRHCLALLLMAPLAAYGLLALHACVRELRSDVASLAGALGVLAASGALASVIARLVSRRAPASGTLATAVVGCAVAVGAALGLRLALPSPAAAWTAGIAAATPAPAAGPALVPAETNVLLLLVDTLRADHLSYAGYPRQTSPALDRLAARSVRFDRAIGQATRTSPNMASLLTGVTPYQHGIVATRTLLPERLQTWGELLEAAGYQTVGILGNPNVGHGFSFTQGMQEVDERFHDRAQSRAEPMVRASVEWLEKRRREPFFLWLHMVDPHRPYESPSPYDTWFVGDAVYHEEVDTILPLTGNSRHGGIEQGAEIEGLRSLADYVARYDGEIRYADHWIGVLLEALDRLDLRRNTLIVFTSDHGESLGEHNFYFAHGTYAHEPTARVPLLFAHPHLPEGRVVDRMVRTIDVLPTVMDLLGLSIPAEVEGRSLRPLFDGAGERITHASITVGQPNAVTLAARTQRWKLVLTPAVWPGFDVWTQAKLSLWPNHHRSRPLRQRHYRTEFYDLELDPTELRNVEGTKPEAERELRSRILAWVDAAGTPDGAQPVATQDIEPGVAERLRELGYLE
jgi:arylsulfatase A-like enzyme